MPRRHIRDRGVSVQVGKTAGSHFVAGQHTTAYKRGVALAMHRGRIAEGIVRIVVAPTTFSKHAEHQSATGHIIAQGEADQRCRFSLAIVQICIYLVIWQDKCHCKH